MLSGETAAGKYPVDALQMMAEIAEMTEPHLDYKVFIEHRSMDGREKISSAVALATVRTAKNLKANAIVTPTMSGNTARLISNFRPKVPIYAITPNSTIQHKLQLIWGVTPLKGYQRDTTDHIMSQAMNVVRSRHLIHKRRPCCIYSRRPCDQHDKRSWCSDKYDARDRGRIRPGGLKEQRSENRRYSYYEKSTICDT